MRRTVCTDHGGKTGGMGWSFSQQLCSAQSLGKGTLLAGQPWCSEAIWVEGQLYCRALGVFGRQFDTSVSVLHLSSVPAPQFLNPGPEWQGVAEVCGMGFPRLLSAYCGIWGHFLSVLRPLLLHLVLRPVESSWKSMMAAWFLSPVVILLVDGRSPSLQLGSHGLRL